MKKLFKVVQRQSFKVRVKFKKCEDGYNLRQSKFIYCESEAEAISLYTERYGVNVDPIIILYGIASIEQSDNLRDVSSDHNISVVICEITCIPFNGRETIHEIKEHMSGLEYHEWFFSGMVNNDIDQAKKSLMNIDEGF